MKLTPMDIKNKEFKKGLRGYSVDEVDEFLEEVVNNYEELYKENSRLKESLGRSNDQVEHYSKIENTIQNTLLLAQNAAEQAKNNSQKESDLIVKNANETAKKIVDKANENVIEVNNEYELVKQEFIKFRAKFRSFMEVQLQTFNDLEKDMTKNYNVSAPVDEVEEEVVENAVEEVIDPTNKINIKNIEDTLTDEMEEIKNFFVDNFKE